MPHLMLTFHLFTPFSACKVIFSQTEKAKQNHKKKKNRNVAGTKFSCRGFSLWKLENYLSVYAGLQTKYTDSYLVDLGQHSRGGFLPLGLGDSCVYSCQVWSDAVLKQEFSEWLQSKYMALLHKAKKWIQNWPCMTWFRSEKEIWKEMELPVTSECPAKSSGEHC